MVEWIVKRAQGDRARVGTLAGMVCIVANVALCAAKGAIGVVSDIGFDCGGCHEQPIRCQLEHRECPWL